MDTAAAWFYFGALAAVLLVLCGLAWIFERAGR